MKTLSLLICCIVILGSAAAIDDAFSIDILPDIRTVSPPPIEQVLYFDFNNTVFQQAILPQLKFTTYGTITSFSALTVANTFRRFIQFVPHEISFTVWRPRGAGLYDVVGHAVLQFGSGALRAGRFDIDNSSGLVPEDLEYFNFTDKEPDYTNPLSTGPVLFQPGDVLGWNQLAGITKKPLSLVYIQTNSISGIDGFRAPSSQQIACSLSECNVGATTLSSIIPYFSVKYVTTAPNASELYCGSLEQLTLCPSTNTPLATTTDSTSATSLNIIIIAAPSVVVVGALGLGIFLIVTVLLYCKTQKRDLQAEESYQLEDQTDVLEAIPDTQVKLSITTTPSVDPNQERKLKQKDLELTGNRTNSTPSTPMEPNPQSSVTAATSVDPDQLYSTVEGEHQQQDIELTENQAYTVTPNIPVEPNQCYGKITDQFYFTVEGEHQLLPKGKQQPNEEYDYAFP